MKKLLLFLGVTVSFAFGAYSKAYLNAHFNSRDSNGDGIVSKSEMPYGPGARAIYLKYDFNSDGILTKKEYIFMMRDEAGETKKQRQVKQAKKGTFDYYDANSDDIISKREVDGQFKHKFYSYDHNGDGVITRREFAQEQQNIKKRKIEQRNKRTFAKLDRDRDGSISLYEISPAFERKFPLFDANGDGMMSWQEYKQMLTGKVKYRNQNQQGYGDGQENVQRDYGY